MNATIEARIKELLEKAENKDLSNSVRYKCRRDAGILRLLGNLDISPEKLDKDDASTFDRLMDPVTYEPVVVAEGDSLMQLLEDNQDRRDVMTKITNACKEAGLKIDFPSGTIIKA
jgi:hypothetical protein